MFRLSFYMLGAFIVLILVVGAVGFFLFLRADFKINKTGAAFDGAAQNLGRRAKNSSSFIKTACREIPLNSSFKAPSHRIEKLNRLMDQPIDWVLTDLNGNTIDLYCLRGRQVIVLNFWATWCAPCIRELPSLSKLAESYKKEIFVLAVSAENQAIVKSFLERSFKGLGPDLKIAAVKEEEKLKRFPKDKIPATYIFNKKGLLKIKHLGEKDWSDKSIVQQILDKEP